MYNASRQTKIQTSCTHDLTSQLIKNISTNCDGYFILFFLSCSEMSLSPTFLSEVLSVFTSLQTHILGTLSELGSSVNEVCSKNWTSNQGPELSALGHYIKHYVRK